MKLSKVMYPTQLPFSTLETGNPAVDRAKKNTRNKVPPLGIRDGSSTRLTPATGA